jgi:nitrous oxidase accessory protein
MIKQILIAALLILFAYELYAKQIRVGKEYEFISIRDAIAEAESGDEIIVVQGIYKEFNLKINKPIKLIGLNHPTIDAMGKGYIFEVLSDSVTISGFRLINVGRSYTSDYAAIHTYRINNFTIDNNIFVNPFFAVLIEKSNYGIISNNIIKGNAVDEHNSGNGIHLWHAAHIQVTGNIVEKMRDGIYFEFAKHSSISKNESSNNLRYGLHFMFSNDNNYENNIFENNGAGVAVMFSKNIIMRKNIFRLNWGTASYGLLLKEINDADISDNVFEQNTIGVNAEGSNRVLFEKNDFKNNGWAIKFHGACYDNKLFNNNFMHNAFDISYKGELNGNNFDSNYWSEYAGYDLNKDNIGDVPYRPVKLFSYVVNRTPETIILLRSLFVDLINFSEKVSPVFTPDNLKDFNPLMKPINDSN